MLRKSPLFVASFLNNSLTLVICPESAMLQKCKIERYKLESWKEGEGHNGQFYMKSSKSFLEVQNLWVIVLFKKLFNNNDFFLECFPSKLTVMNHQFYFSKKVLFWYITWFQTNFMFMSSFRYLPVSIKYLHKIVYDWYEMYIILHFIAKFWQFFCDFQANIDSLHAYVKFCISLR